MRILDIYEDLNLDNAINKTPFLLQEVVRYSEIIAIF